MTVRIELIARTLVSAAPIALAFVAYGMVRHTGEPFLGLDAEALGLGARIEFLVLHSIGFLGLLALVRPPRAEWATLKWLAVALLGAMYLNGALNMGGREGLLLFLSLTITTYLGFFLNFMSSGAAVSLALRWFISMVLLGVASGITGIEGDLEDIAWTAPDTGLRFGQWFFGMLLLVELTGLYHLKVWSEIGESLAAENRAAIRPSTEPWHHKLVFGLVPLVGTAVLCALPLFVAQALGAGFFELVYAPYGPTLDERVAAMRAQGHLHEWGPVFATGTLLAGRWVQLAWLVEVLIPDPQRRLWQRKGVMVLFALVGLAYIATGWWLASKGKMVVRSGVSPGALCGHFVLVEMFMLLALIPLTWVAMVRRLRGRRAP